MASTFAIGGLDDTGKAAISLSSDGLIWVRQTFDVFGATGQVNGIAFGNNVWVAVGLDESGNPAIAWSLDGQSWTLGSLGDYIGTCEAVKFGDGIFVVVGAAFIDDISNGSIATTVDGTVLSQVTVLAFGPDVSEGGALTVNFDSGNWIVAGNPNNDLDLNFARGIAISSAPETTWTPCAMTIPIQGQLSGSLIRDGIYYACGQDAVGAAFAQLQTSLDGFNFTQSEIYNTGGNPIGRAMLFAVNKFIVGVDDTAGTDAIYTSSDASTWTAKTITDPDAIYFSVGGLVADDDIIVGAAIRTTTSFNGIAINSVDAETWNIADTGFGGDSSVALCVGVSTEVPPTPPVEREPSRLVRDPWDIDEWGRFYPGAGHHNIT